MRALCKKGEQCEFLHEYNVRRMPECVNFSRHGTCPNGDDCSYQHVNPASKRASCPHFDRGFCPLGPICANRHIRKDKICPFYMAGFCPDGSECKQGAHARYPTELKKPMVRGTEPEEPEETAEKKQEASMFEHEDRMQQDGGGSKYGRGGGGGQRGRGWSRGGAKRGGFVKRG
jgi:cleavage and polyadenylation specificity factor subunit 4